jgi:hypothetical protein
MPAAALLVLAVRLTILALWGVAMLTMWLARRAWFGAALRTRARRARLGEGPGSFVGVGVRRR